MPYITQVRRSELDMNVPFAATSGELNYLFTKVLFTQIKGRVSYSRINDILGALEGAKLEFYRRVAVPYEQEKEAENGDVYE
jgi:hypothetical protein